MIQPATCIALLRGINVGGHHKVPMKELRELLTAHGYGKVRTYIQSGNVVYDSTDAPSRAIDALVEERFGFCPSVFTLTLEALQEAAANNPWPDAPGKAVHFVFCSGNPGDVDRDLLDSLRTRSEAFRQVGQVFYLHTPDGFGRSKLANNLDRAFRGVAITARNLNTVNRLLELAAA